MNKFTHLLTWVTWQDVCLPAHFWRDVEMYWLVLTNCYLVTNLKTLIIMLLAQFKSLSLWHDLQPYLLFFRSNLIWCFSLVSIGQQRKLYSWFISLTSLSFGVFFTCWSLCTICMSFIFVISGHNVYEGKWREIYAIWYFVIYEWLFRLTIILPLG